MVTRTGFLGKTAAESGIAYTFVVGDDVELFINGCEAEPGQFKVGDFVGVWYDLSQNPTETAVKPIQIRSTRANVSPVKGQNMTNLKRVTSPLLNRSLALLLSLMEDSLPKSADNAFRTIVVLC